MLVRAILSLQDTISWFQDLARYGDNPDNKVHGAHLGPAGPRWAPWTLLSGKTSYRLVNRETQLDTNVADIPATNIHDLNSLLPGDDIRCQWTGLSLTEVMTCGLFRATPLHEPMLMYRPWRPQQHISMKINLQFQPFSFTEICIWYCRCKISAVLFRLQYATRGHPDKMFGSTRVLVAVTNFHNVVYTRC